MKLLVHACCGPCSIMPTRLLMDAGHDITVLYANSNIAPASEYERRLHELQRYADLQGFEVLEGAYEPATWERDVAPIGEALKQYSPAFGEAFASQQAGDGNAPSEPDSAAPTTVAELLDDERRKERCRACYRLRLEEAAKVAHEGGFDALTTTLAVSPYQFTEVIHEELIRASEQADVKPLFQDFRPYYDEATRISRELNMYRQNYCGCRFSVQEGEATRAFIKQQRKAKKAAEAAQREARDAARKGARDEKAAQKQAYAAAQAKKHAILKELRRKQAETPDSSM